MQNTTPQQGNTIPSQGETQERVPRMPHEHDESADSQGAGEAPNQRLGKAAQQDIARGLVDTDKGPVMDKVYDKVRQGTSDPVKKLRP